MKQIMPEVVAKVRQCVAPCIPAALCLAVACAGEYMHDRPHCRQRLMTSSVVCPFKQDAAAFGKRAVSFVSAFDLEAAAAYDISSPRSDASDDARQTIWRDGGGSLSGPYEHHHLDADQGP